MNASSIPDRSESSYFLRVASETLSKWPPEPGRNYTLALLVPSQRSPLMDGDSRVKLYCRAPSPGPYSDQGRSQDFRNGWAKYYNAREARENFAYRKPHPLIKHSSHNEFRTLTSYSVPRASDLRRKRW